MLDPAAARRWLDVVEAALVAGALGRPAPPLAASLTDAEVAAGRAAVAAKFLAVGTPRSMALIGLGELAPWIVAGQRAYAAPRELRVFEAVPVEAARTADGVGGRVGSLAEACAADIVVARGPVALRREWFRGGTHLTALDPGVVCDPALLAAAVVHTDGTPPPGVRVHATLGAVAAGLVDGRQLDEITVLLAG
ncbi:MAG TPA: hypothetical protein VM734_08485 [Kofleriaceae bacterium]|nr:hypothetical protein [Kofleriaceae bacterium]